MPCGRFLRSVRQAGPPCTALALASRSRLLAPPSPPQVSTEKVQSYSEAFVRITEATGIADVDVLVATFVNAEDENYRLFKYVEELNQARPQRGRWRQPAVSLHQPAAASAFCSASLCPSGMWQ